DLLVRAAHHTFGLPTLITRCSNNYGPYQFPEKIIPLFISNLLRDEAVPVYGDGQQVRDWIHVRDHCAAIARVGQAGKVGEVYNIGGRGDMTTWQRPPQWPAAGGTPPTLIRYVQDRPGHDRRYAIDCRKMEQDLGWKPQVPFEVGLRETVAWYRTHGEWIANIRSGEY